MVEIVRVARPYPAPMQRRALPVVHSLIAAPCDVPWASMVGDDRRRHCGECKRDVHNLSAMTEVEVVAFLEGIAALPENVHAPCISLFQRADGTMLTADCPVGLRRRRRRAILVSTMQLGAVAVVAVTALATMFLHQSASKLDEERPVLAHTAVLAPVVEPPPYRELVVPPTPSHTRDVPEGVHMAGGPRMNPNPPTIRHPPPAHTVGRKVAQKPPPEPTDILRVLAESQTRF
jgi:hypothetical protein